MVGRGSNQGTFAATRAIRASENSALSVRCRTSWDCDRPIQHQASHRKTPIVTSSPSTPKSLKPSSTPAGGTPGRPGRPSPSEYPEGKIVHMRPLPLHQVETLSGPWTSSGELVRERPEALIDSIPFNSDGVRKNSGFWCEWYRECLISVLGTEENLYGQVKVARSLSDQVRPSIGDPEVATGSPT